MTGSTWETGSKPEISDNSQKTKNKLSQKTIIGRPRGVEDDKIIGFLLSPRIYGQNRKLSVFDP